MNKADLHEGFVALARVAPECIIDLKYCGNDNLIGRPLEGYAPVADAIMTHESAKALKAVGNAVQQPAVKKMLKMTEPTLLIWDTYRPLMACEDFWQWSQTDCQKTKKDYYPHVDKRDFFKLGYVVRKSSHCRGSTVDLNIIDTMTGTVLDMGTRFDFMDPLSHPDNKAVGEAAFTHRQLLKNLMRDNGFVGIDQEWWHFTYENEPFPDTYFNFPVIKY